MATSQALKGSYPIKVYSLLPLYLCTGHILKKKNLTWVVFFDTKSLILGTTISHISHAVWKIQTSSSDVISFGKKKCQKKLWVFFLFNVSRSTSINNTRCIGKLKQIILFFKFHRNTTKINLSSVILTVRHWIIKEWDRLSCPMIKLKGKFCYFIDFDYLIFDRPYIGTAMFHSFALYGLFVVLTPVWWTPWTLVF